VTFDGNISKWKVQRWSKSEYKKLYNGHYDDEETAARASDTLARKLIKNGEKYHKLNFPENDTEIYPEKRKTFSKFIGVSFNEQRSKWKVQRWSKNENKKLFNGYYDDEETAAHASDTLARKIMEKGEQNYKFNFPDDDTEVYPKKDITSKFIGVSYHKNTSKWYVQRKNDYKNVSYGYYEDEETAAHASDTLARKLMENGEKNHMLNFTDDDTEVYREEKKTSAYIGVSYRLSRWRVVRYSKNEKKIVYNGFYEDEETAARASDTLAKKIMANGEQNHKLNFPNDNTEPQRNKRKRSQDENLEQL